MRERIAIVGGGVAGLTVGYLLHQKYDVTLFEKSNRIGGNAWTYVSRDGESADVGAAAFGKVGYRHFFELLSRLKIETAPYRSYASFMNLDTKSGLYLTPSLKGLLAQRFQVLGPRHLGDLFRLHQAIAKARRLLERGSFEGLTLREAIEKLPHLNGWPKLVLLFGFLLMTSMSYAALMDGPAAHFMKLIDVHNDVLSFRAPYSVMGVKSLTRSYIEALVSSYREQIVVDSKIERVSREKDRIVVSIEDGPKQVFDKLVVAINADQALRLLGAPTPEEKRLLGAWRYNEGRLVVHRDHSLLPARPLTQGYTFLYTEREGVLETSVNGCTWHEPGVASTCDLIGSQNPNFPINPDLVECETALRTPIYDFRSFSTIGELPSLNGIRNTYYCGSHFGFGLHEDAVRSAVEVAGQLGVDFWAKGTETR